MKGRVKEIGVASLLLALATTPAVAAENLINEPSFENTVNAGVFGDYTFMVDIDPDTGQWNEMTGWAGTFGAIDITGVPGNPITFATPYDGLRAIKISIASPNREWWWPPIAFVRPNFRTVPAWWNPDDLASIDRVAVSPGDEVYASARIFTDAELIDGQFGMIKVAFFDANGLDISPSVISQGEFDGLIEPLQCSEFPGAVSALKLDGASPVGEWLKVQAQTTAGIVSGDGTTDVLYPTCKDWTNDGVYNPIVVANAPPGAVEMNVFLFNIDPNLTGNPIYFDDVFLGILDPDDDKDRIENRVDGDPINASVAFGDGTTSGTVETDTDGILAIDDAAEQDDGISIVSDPGNGSPARIRVCDSTASLSIRPGSELVVTCGSVILDVAPDSAPVTMEIELNGETATVEVPPENTLTFEPETASLEVASDLDEAKPIVLTIGGTEIVIEAGETLALVPFSSFVAGVEFDDEETGIEAVFSLGAASNGIYPPSEDVSVSIGTSVTTIPAGLFGDDGDGEFKFEGDIAGVETKIEIKSLDEGAYSIEADMESRLFYLTSPVKVGLTIGDDRGTVIAAQDD